MHNTTQHVSERLLGSFFFFNNANEKMGFLCSWCVRKVRKVHSARVEPAFSPRRCRRVPRGCLSWAVQVSEEGVMVSDWWDGCGWLSGLKSE